MVSCRAKSIPVPPEYKVSLSSPGCPQTCCAPQVGLELMFFLPLHPMYWDYRCVPPHLAFCHYLTLEDSVHPVDVFWQSQKKDRFINEIFFHTNSIHTIHHVSLLLCINHLYRPSSPFLFIQLLFPRLLFGAKVSSPVLAQTEKACAIPLVC